METQRPVGQKPVPAMPGHRRIAGPERAPHPRFREVRPVDGEMAPPGAMVVPEVVAGVLPVYPYRKRGCRHGTTPHGIRSPAKKKIRRTIRRGGLPRDVMFRGAGLAHPAGTLGPRRATVVSQPGWQAPQPRSHS